MEDHSMPSRQLVNVACGTRYHEDWINLDFHPDGKKVVRHNLLKGMPFEDNSIDVVYSSHFLEHLTPEQGNNFIGECYRVLKKGAIIRLVVPDLENIARNYIKYLELAKHGQEYDKLSFVVLELIDQLVRNDNGGQLGKYYQQIQSGKNKEMHDFIKLRTGENFGKEINCKRTITIPKIFNRLIYNYLRIVKLLIPKDMRDLIIDNCSIGEKHKWMYDEVQLTILLRNKGFKMSLKKSFNQSEIQDFNKYMLDINFDGTPYKGEESLYIEARK